VKKYITTLFLILSICSGYSTAKESAPKTPLKGNRFLTFNTVIRVNQIEVARDKNIGRDERHLHTPEKARKFREAIEKGFPGARITWAFSWLALHDTTPNYKQLRELVVSYHHKYGDEITFIPGAYFANAHNSTEQVNRDLHDGLNRVSEITGNGYRPKSILAGFLSAKNMEYLATKEGIHVCQGNIWSQYAIDAQDGDGSVCYPYFPSKEHFCKPAQGKDEKNRSLISPLITPRQKSQNRAAPETGHYLVTSIRNKPVHRTTPFLSPASRRIRSPSSGNVTRNSSSSGS
jgi:hypothetical protein